MRIRTEVMIGTAMSALVIEIAVRNGLSYTQATQSLTPLSPVTTTSEIPNSTPTQQMIVLASAEVAKHRTPSDCWLIISSDVIDVTNYVQLHPGGASRITPYCGTDATDAFATQGGKGAHSQFAYQQASMLTIGKLNGSADPSVIQQINQSLSNQSVFQQKRKGNDD